MNIHSSTDCVVCTCSSFTKGELSETISRKLRPSKSSSASIPQSNMALFPCRATSFAEPAMSFSPTATIFSRTSTGSGASTAETPCLSAEPFVFLDDASNEVVESLETSDSDDDRGVKPGRWAAAEGARLLGLFGPGEYDRFDGGGGEPFAGVECPDNLSSHIALFSSSKPPDQLSSAQDSEPS